MALILATPGISPVEAQATGTVRVSNQQQAGNTAISIDGDVDYAQPFCTGASNVTVTKVSLETAYKYLSSGPAVVNTIGPPPVVTIRSDSSGTPGSVLDTLTNPSFDTSLDTAEDFTSSSDTALDAGTTYWLVINWPSHQDRNRRFQVGSTRSPGEDSTSDAGWGIGNRLLAGNREYLKPEAIRMAVYATGDAPSNSSPVFHDSDCDGAKDSFEFSIDENAAAGAVLGEVTARDLDGDTPTHTVGGTDAGEFNQDFALGATDGRITVKQGATIDYESLKKYSITINVTDGEDSSGNIESDPTTDETVSVEISVNNLNEPGVIEASTASPKADVELTLTITDPDRLMVGRSAEWFASDTADGTFTALSDGFITPSGVWGYTPQASEVGKFLKVVADYYDNQCRLVRIPGNPCLRTAEFTFSNAVVPNALATGQPTIGGTAQVGQTLTASTSGIADADGLSNVSYSYQWLADDMEIDGATGSTYTVRSSDSGKVIKVRVDFTDDTGSLESLTSEGTAAVVMGGL